MAIIGPNPLLGVLFHWLGGLASGSFYVPYRGVKHWAWGNLLVGRWIFQLDYRSLDASAVSDP